MKDPLDRLLRLRSLLENVSRIELEVRLRELARVEEQMEALDSNRKADRHRSFQGFAHAENPVWVEAEAMGELTGWQRGQLDPLREKRVRDVDAAKEQYLERRKEFMQVESVIEARAIEREAAQTRREQRELDDWFGQRSHRTPHI